MKGGNRRISKRSAELGGLKTFAFLTKITFTRYKDFFLLLFSSVLSAFAINLWFYLLLPHLSYNVGLNEVEIGTLMSIRKLVGFMFALVGGVLADKIGRRITCIIATLLLSIGILTLNFHFFLLIITAICLISAGMYIRSPVIKIFVAEKLPEKVMGKGLGLFFTITSLVSAIAPIVGGTIALYSYNVLFFTSFAVSIISALPLIALRETIKVRESGERLRGIKTSIRQLSIVLKDKTLVIYYFVWGVYAFLTEIPITFIPLYAAEVLKMSSVEIGTMFMLVSLASMASYIPGGALADRIGSINTLAFSLGMNIPLLMLLPLLDKWLFIAVYTLSAFIFMMHEAPETSFIVERTSLESRATAMSLLVMLIMPFSIPSPIIGGILWREYSPYALFTILAPALVVIALFRALIKPLKKKA